MEREKSGVPIVFDRILDPTPQLNLFHYCSTPTLLSILKTNKLRFSDANMMNDGEESRYGYSLFERAANLLLEISNGSSKLDGLDVTFFESIDNYLSPRQFQSHPVLACFSRSPDVLSQWRAYAQDGQGWAIGFDANAIRKMPVMLLDVLYEPAQQLEEVKNYLSAMYLLWRKDGRDFKVAVETMPHYFPVCLWLTSTLRSAKRTRSEHFTNCGSTFQKMAGF